mmetsp:Transcript_32398/g.59573  ORF Transcript_32398/g.59573 Transcript_32398/m.59573 type:complete len:316 (+) Transcript_32398:126-1073(+)
MIKSALYACNLRAIALLRSRARRIRINLSSRPVRCISHASTKPQTLFAGNDNDTLLRDRLADDFAVLVCRSNVCYLANRFNHCCEPLRRRTSLILHQIEPVGDLPLPIVVDDAVSSRFGGSKFRFIRVGCFVQVQMTSPILDMRHVLSEEPNQRRRFFRRGFWIERPTFNNLPVRVEGTIWVDSLGGPALNPLVSPGTHARNYKNVEVPRIVCRLAAGQEGHGSLNSRRFVSVNASCDENIHLFRGPFHGPYGKKRKAARSIRLIRLRVVMSQLAISYHFEQFFIGPTALDIAQRLNARGQIGVVAPLFGPGVAP